MPDSTWPCDISSRSTQIISTSNSRFSISWRPQWLASASANSWASTGAQLGTAASGRQTHGGSAAAMGWPAPPSKAMWAQTNWAPQLGSVMKRCASGRG